MLLNTAELGKVSGFQNPERDESGPVAFGPGQCHQSDRIVNEGPTFPACGAHR